MPSRIWLTIILALSQTNALAAAALPPATYTHSNVPLSTPFGQAIVSQFQPEISPDRIFASRFETGEVLGAVPFTPPEPESILPPPDPTIFPSFGELAGPLYAGPNPIQRGMQGDPIQDYRVAIVRGRVLDSAGLPLAGVLVRALNQPEVGYTYSRSSGYYDLVLNGGGDAILDFSKPGLLTSQRRKLTPWRDFSLFPDVVLIAPDALVTPVQLGTGAPMQLASGSTQSDQDGSRTSRVYFPSGTTANLIYADGRVQAMPQLMFRATEYTVGARGPERMPGSLPANIAYTFAVELSSDEALSTGAQRVQFNQPLSLYVDNFLQVKTGEAVPLGYYEQSTGEWIGAPNGRVVEVLSITGGIANLDVEGNSTAATPAAYAALGITQEERTMMAQRYAVGANFTRSVISHFTPWDCNFPYYPDPGNPPPPPPDDPPGDPPPDGMPPPPPPPPEDPPCLGPSCDDTPPPPDDDDPDDPCGSEQGGGSVIDCNSGALREVIPVAGTSEMLNYTSERAPGYKNSSTMIRAKLTGNQLPANLTGVSVFIRQGNRSVLEQYSPSQILPNQVYRNRLDQPHFYGRAFNGALPIQIDVCYQYPLRYAATGAEFYSGWARFSAAQPLSARNTNMGVTIRDRQRGGLGCSTTGARANASLLPSRTATNRYNQAGQALGGMSLSMHQVYDPNAGVLYDGTGHKRRVRAFEGGTGAVGQARDAIIETLPLALPSSAGLFVGADGAAYTMVTDGFVGPIQVKVVTQGPGGVTAEVGQFPSCLIDSKDPTSCDGAALIGVPEQLVVIAPNLSYVIAQGMLFRLQNNALQALPVAGTNGEDCFASDISLYENTVLLACNSKVIGGWIATFSALQSAPVLPALLVQVPALVMAQPRLHLPWVALAALKSVPMARFM